MAFLDEQGRVVYQSGSTDQTLTIVGSASLPGHVAVGAIFNGLLIVGSASLPGHTASGGMGSNRSIIGSAYLPSHTAEGRINVATGLRGSASLPSHTASGKIFTRMSICGDAVLPSHKASGIIATILSICGDAVLPVHTASGAIYLVQVDTFATWLVNTKTLTHFCYDPFAFNSLFEVDGLIYASGPAGVVQITGDLDGDAQINVSATWGMTNFEKDEEKRMNGGYVTMRSTSQMNLTLKADEGTPVESPVISRQLPGLHTERAKTAKGQKGTFWQPKLSNTDGADCEAFAVDLAPVILSRRV